jgi:predicted flap endonuclease-1-like 5' DNA nuclease
VEFIEANWLLILLVLAVVVLITWYIFHAARRTRVTGERRDVLDEGAAPAARNQALIDAPTAAAPQVPIPPATPAGLAGVGEAVEAAVERQQIRATVTSGSGDDLTRLKGVGPKLAAQLGEMGVTTFSEIAAWSDADIDRIDAGLGRFQGRIRRDAWVEQARLLAAGDSAGFAAKFGNIT